MRTMQDEWRYFRDLCYPTGMDPEQNKQLHQAFFAGALSVLGVFDEIAKIPDGSSKDVHAYEKLRQEVMQVCGFRAGTLKNRN